MKLLIGIDPGVKTGMAFMFKGNKKIILETDSFWKAINTVSETIDEAHEENYKIEAHVEDPNYNKPVFPKKLQKMIYAIKKLQFTDKANMKAQINKITTETAKAMRIAQNVGMNKGHAKLWIAYFDHKDINCVRHKPSKKSITKTDKKYFKQLTGYTDRSSEHSRDAAMLIFGL